MTTPTLTDADLDRLGANFPGEWPLEVAVTALIAEVRRARATITAARDTFRRYAAIHRSKGTADGETKAKANDMLAELMEAALPPSPSAATWTGRPMRETNYTTETPPSTPRSEP